MVDVSRKTTRLTIDHLTELPDPVRSCLFWELSPVDRARLEYWTKLGAQPSHTLTQLLKKNPAQPAAT